MSITMDERLPRTILYALHWDFPLPTKEKSKKTDLEMNSTGVGYWNPRGRLSSQ
jgi:hypothetical protein